MLLRPQKILVTGGAGFIGSMFVRQCLEADACSVVTLDKLTYAGHRESLAEVLENPRHELVVGDIADAELVRDLLKQHQPEAVVHLAAESHVDRSIATPANFASTNVLGTCVLLEEVTQYWQQLANEARTQFRFLQVSTDEVFGSAAEDAAFSEASPFAPNSPYAASKAGAEHFVRAFQKTYGLPVLVANPSNNFGPRQHPEKLIPKMILNAAAGKELPVYGDGLHSRDWLYVEDCCRALLAILKQGTPGDRFTLGGENCVTNLHVVETICTMVDEILGDGDARKRLITLVEDRPGHDRCYRVSNEKIRSELGWQPQVGFQQGLLETVVWYLNNPEWVEAAQAPEE